MSRRRPRRITEAERAALLAVSEPYAKSASAARSLGISEQALESRLRRLYDKLEVASAAQAWRALARLDSGDSGIGGHSRHVEHENRLIPSID